MENSYSIFSEVAQTQKQTPVVIQQQAAKLYEGTCSLGKFKRFITCLMGRSCRLLNLSEISRKDGIESSHYVGHKTVEISQIRGSESRVDDFDNEFKPVRETTRERWVRIARAFLGGESLPPVDLIQVDDMYFVRDGHHRVSVARTLGMQYIDAEIIAMQIRKNVY